MDTLTEIISDLEFNGYYWSFGLSHEYGYHLRFYKKKGLTATECKTIIGKDLEEVYKKYESTTNKIQSR